jgi:aerobic carbon-monoxide dehydrogenase large subunit
VLGLDPERITLHASDPDGPPLVGDGTIGSRSMMNHGSAVFMAARAAVQKGTELAAKALEVAKEDLEFSKGSYRVKGTDVSISFSEVLKRYGSALDSMGENPQHSTFPGGVHVAEVEIDPETGALELLRYVAVDDCGRVINHTLLEGQIHGGIVQGVGQALWEGAVYDENGQLLTGSMMDYALPKADAFPKFELGMTETPTSVNPLGVKGIGETGTIASTPAIYNAVMDAVAPFGVERIDMPLTPERVWRAIRDAKRS